MSRRAVSWEHFASFAHFEVVSLPSKPSSSRFTTRRWRSFRERPDARSQNRAFASTPAKAVPALSMERPRQARNQSIHSVTSVVPRCVRSRTS